MTETEQYVENKVKALIEQGEKTKGISFKVSTCDSSFYGWDATYHSMMPRIATKLREKGYGVSSTVSFGVTDWTIIKP